MERVRVAAEFVRIANPMANLSWERNPNSDSIKISNAGSTPGFRLYEISRQSWTISQASQPAIAKFRQC